MTVSDVVESLGTVVLDAISVCERKRLDEGLLLVLPVYFRILHNEYRQRAVPVLPVLVQGGVDVLSDVLIESAQIIMECSDEVCKQTNAGTRVRCRFVRVM